MCIHILFRSIYTASPSVLSPMTLSLCPHLIILIIASSSFLTPCDYGGRVAAVPCLVPHVKSTPPPPLSSGLVKSPCMRKSWNDLFIGNVCVCVSLAPTGPPQNLQVFNATTTTLSVKWDHAPGPVQNYKLTYQPVAGGKTLSVS